jgi:predicted amidohydrolase
MPSALAFPVLSLTALVTLRVFSMSNPPFCSAAVLRPRIRAVCLLALALAGWVIPTLAASVSESASAVAAARRRENLPPRKVLVGSVVSGYTVFARSLEQRLDAMDGFVATMTQRAARDFSGRRLDLVVLPETLLARPGVGPAQQSVTLDEVRARIAHCAQQNGCYLVVPMILAEGATPVRYSNAAVLVDRAGGVAGIYRKVHAVAPQGSDIIEGGTTPGRDFPVFQCDFGRLGIQICFDMVYPDGWDALARRGAEIIALPSASPETAHPMMHALRHACYIVSACPRDHAAVYNPLGVIEADATTEGAVLVHEIDLSFALVHWDERLEEGEALKRRFGDKVGYRYYRAEDGGIFWSNDPAMPIGQMIASLGLQNQEAEMARLQRLQEGARHAAAQP